MTELFSTIQFGDFSLKNRITMAPMTRSRSTPEHVPLPLMAEYYSARAAAGLLITEGIAPHPDGVGYARIPGLYNQEQVEGWKPVTDAVHQSGGVIVAQLMHTGRVGHTGNMPEGAVIRGPSATVAPGEMYTDAEGPQAHPEPVPMDAEQVEIAIESYVTAAKNALAAGFDGVEIHGANGYLIDQFLSPNVNEREDEWGGSLEGRSKFALEVAKRVSGAIGAGKTGIRLSPFGAFNGIAPWDSIAADFTWLAGKLGELKLAYLHLVDHSSMGAPAFPAEAKKAIYDAFKGTRLLSGGYDQERAVAALKAGEGDLVAFGRPFISNPDLVERFKTGADLTEADPATFYTPGEKGYTDYPTL